MRKLYPLAGVMLAAAIIPADSLACACGCGVFDVATSSMIPTGPGGTVFFETDFLNQTRNWAGSSSADKSANDDKHINSVFLVAGAEYMFNRNWGAEIQVPYTYRDFRTADDATGLIDDHSRAGLGDIRIQGIYSGFSSDMSTGITFGVKLPTGNYSYSGFDRDTSIGTGSTDSLLGGYHQSMFGHSSFGWFMQGTWDHPVVTTSGYRPGDEIDAATGVYYEYGKAGVFSNIIPLLQVIGSQRWQDRGVQADPSNSGYTRFLISPGIEADLGKFRAYADVELPVYQYVNGNQLVSAELFKVVLSYDF